MESHASYVGIHKMQVGLDLYTHVGRKKGLELKFQEIWQERTASIFT